MRVLPNNPNHIFQGEKKYSDGIKTTEITENSSGKIFLAAHPSANTKVVCELILQPDSRYNTDNNVDACSRIANILILKLSSSILPTFSGINRSEVGLED